MIDDAQEFRDSIILNQGLMVGFVFDLPKISLEFNFPKRFEVHFTRAVDYRIRLPLVPDIIESWSASNGSEFLKSLPDLRSKLGHSPIQNLDRLCHFHITFSEGNFDVLAENYIFMMVSR